MRMGAPTSQCRVPLINENEPIETCSHGFCPEPVMWTEPWTSELGPIFTPACRMSAVRKRSNACVGRAPATRARLRRESTEPNSSDASFLMRALAPLRLDFDSMGFVREPTILVTRFLIARKLQVVWLLET